jgi:F-type H+-transporting ATPase subunit b
MELLGKLGIDFKLLIAQIINFLVLLWLLKIFLYGPLVRVLERRSNKAREIEEGDRDIQRKKEEMEKKEEEIIQQTKEKTRQIIEEGREISREEKERVLRRAEEETREIVRKTREKAEMEAERIKADEKEEILKNTKRILGDVLSKSFSKELHRKYIEETMDSLKKVDFKKIARREVISVTVVSAYPLSKQEEKKISSLLFRRLKNPAFQEKVDSDLLAGIKVVVDGFSIDGSLKEKIRKLI